MHHSSHGQAPNEEGDLPTDQPALSICVATFNRRPLLQRLLSSILAGSRDAEGMESVEWVIVDDGSTDDTESLIDEWRDAAVIIRYVQQANAGRAQALKKAVLLASGRYTVIMDSDDYFTEDGLGIILREIRRLSTAPVIHDRPLVGALFGTVILSSAAPTGRANLPATNTRTNFVAARADFRCEGDLKEVVETQMLQEVFREADFDVRRVPTYLWWAQISLRGDCRMIREVVAVKEYMPDGMTANIFRLKTANPLPMAKLYGLLSRARIYRSVFYRMRSKLLWYRYALLSGTASDLPLADRILYAPAWLIYLSDRLRMVRLQRRGVAS